MIKIAYIIVVAMSVTACSTAVPITKEFPEVSPLLLEKCPQLITIDGTTTTLSELTRTITKNYTTYYDCAVKNDAWIEWYQKQKKIYEQVK